MKPFFVNNSDVAGRLHEKEGGKIRPISYEQIPDQGAVILRRKTEG